MLRPGETTYWVHAPHCHAVPVLRTTERTRLELHSDPKAESLRKLGRLSPLFRGIWNEGQARPTFQFLGTSEDVPPKSIIQPLASPPKWNKKLLSLVEAATRAPSATLVCGPKSAGKSTFSRLLTNRLLTSAGGAKGVIILDLDPGQPEYAPPGTLSLVHVSTPNLGAPFTHPSLDDGAYRVLRCHSLASVNPASAADLHFECAMDLYDLYRRMHRHCPLIVNTPGWVLSLGLELLVQVIVNIRPEVVYMSEEGPMETVDALTDAARDGFTALPSQPAEFASRTAAHFRDMQTISYFHSAPDGLRLSWTPSALSSARPLVIHYIRSGIRGILRYDYQLQADLLSEAINGAILAVVEVESPEALRGLPDPRPTPEGIPFIPNPNDVALDPRHSRTIGLVLVRGVDAGRKTMQVLTPMPLQSIARARAHGHDIVLVHGKFDAPTWAYTEHLHERDLGEAIAELEVTDEDTSEDSSEETDLSVDVEEAVPWVEVLKGNQKRPVGSRVWRVRRDLGRATD
ncbi:Polynucleotide 5'-hydroxyl-kinase grc3, variant 2 [Purpureocillium takamizusanense]|nr:Polynucleotide 5'-hydroxyl-kinase grc3, variant 2 [Purpureocillium takamizusanense]UNI17872.1 Polynucleotide 5'-hydroxyl-kinase grc3, variant 2 [Purpureocillium takamizusanense]